MHVHIVERVHVQGGCIMVRSFATLVIEDGWKKGIHLDTRKTNLMAQQNLVLLLILYLVVKSYNSLKAVTSLVVICLKRGKKKES